MNASGEVLIATGEDQALDEPWLLTPSDVSRLLRISRSKVYQLLGARRGGLKSIVIGRSRRIRRTDLREWIEAQQGA